MERHANSEVILNKYTAALQSQSQESKFNDELINNQREGSFDPSHISEPALSVRHD